MRAIGRSASEAASIYFTGGVTAVSYGWREATVDVDLTIYPESDAILRVLPELKERLSINIELAAPDHFIPELPGWRERSVFIAQHGRVSFFHYDLYSQALSKIERGHRQDVLDVSRMLDGGLVERTRLGLLFSSIEPQLYRYPAIDPKTLRAAVEKVIRPGG